VTRPRPRPLPFSDEEIAFVVMCARRGFCGKETAIRLNEKFAGARSIAAVLNAARRNGTGFRSAGRDAAARRIADAAAPAVTVTALRHERPYQFSYQPALMPTARGRLIAELERRADEPPPLGPPGDFVPGCKWLHGEPRADTWRQCAHKRAPASAYCGYHRARTIRVRTNIASPLAGEDKMRRAR